MFLHVLNNHFYKCRIRVELNPDGVLWYYPEFKKHWWNTWMNYHGWLDVKKAEMEIKARLKLKSRKHGNNKQQ
jgi:hypothetical protein